MTIIIAHVFEAQADWLTLIAHSDAKQPLLQGAAVRWQDEEEHEGNRHQPFSFLGYLGQRVGRVALGGSHLGVCCQLQGDLARQHFDRALSLCDRVSRVDLAVTVRTEAPEAGLAWQAYELAEARYQLHPTSPRPELHADADGGQTCYLGARTSDWFGRLYSREAKCRAEHDEEGVAHYRNAWRYELEIKGHSSQPICDELLRNPNRPDLIQSTVHAWFTRAGVDPVFPTSGAQALRAGFRGRTDDESRLRWVERSVRPALQCLRERYTDDELRQRLGLVPREPPGSHDVGPQRDRA